MSRIICDTGVFYKSLSNPRWKGLLTATFINYYELSYSENMYKEMELWKHALRNLATVPVYCYYTSPVKFITMRDDEQTNIFAFNRLRDVRKAFEYILNNDISGWNENIKTYLKGKNKYYYDYASYMEKLIVASRRKAKANPLGEINIVDSIPLFREKFCDAFLSGAHYKIDKTKIDWSEHELLERAGVQFFYEMEYEEKGWQVNDFHDLCNLMYVSPRDQYLVYENKWRGLIERAKMSHYLLPIGNNTYYDHHLLALGS